MKQKKNPHSSCAQPISQVDFGYPEPLHLEHDNI